MSEPAQRFPPTVRRLAWLHFANDFTLDFLTPLLPTGVPIAWLGVMEGLADGIGQALKLFTGRASDRSGKRVPWVRAGYVANGIVRPLTAIGLAFAWPLWVIACRVGDRVGKGLRGSATDALVADWTDQGERARAYAWTRTMDHLGATAGGAAATIAAYFWADHLAWLVAALAVPALAMLWLCRGITDIAKPEASVETATLGYWPTEKRLNFPLVVLTLAGIGKIGPLLVLIQVAGLPENGQQGSHWALWQICLGWAVLGLAQAGAAAVAGHFTEKFGPRAFLASGWIVGAVLFAGLAFVHGAWLIAFGLGYGVLSGFTEGSEKTYIADIAPKRERAVSFGAYALLGAGSALVANSLCGWGLSAYGARIFIVPAAFLLLSSILLSVRRS